MIQDRLLTCVQQHDLLKTKFYQAWSMGELPVSALRAYAEEYGAFISLLPLGWETQGDLETAEEEQEHIELWEEFADALETHIQVGSVKEVSALIELATRLFSDPVEALGALYAFEVQQPATAVSKLEGLRAHYSLPKSVEPYFEVHSRNHHEAEKLLARISKLTAPDKERVVAACGEMCVALERALEGIYEARAARATS